MASSRTSPSSPFRGGSPSRRSFLRAGVLGVAGVAAGTLPLGAASTLPSVDRRRPTPTSPDEALERLMAGNRRFVSGDVEAPRRGAARIRELAGGQSPYAAVLGCADSRVPAEILFDEGLGDLFTVRVAGNVASSEEIASLEYAVGVLGSQLVMVLGHTACGAVTAALEGKAVPGQISTLFRHITPAIPAGASVNEAVEANVRHQVRVLEATSTVVKEAVEAGNVRVQGAIYSLDDGSVQLVD